MLQEAISRRSFLRCAALGAVGATLAACGASRNAATQETEPPAPAEHRIPRRPLGRTGAMVSILGLGGAIAVARSPEMAARIVNRAIDLGVNYIDTAHQYGASEANIGQVMRERREEVILASKTDDRTYDGTMRQFELSLRRLQTDRIDVYQLHAIHGEGDLRTALAADGAITAIEQLRAAGSVRYVGITGHKNSDFFARALAEYPFDCVLMAINAGDVHYDSMIRNALPAACARDMGVIAMKVAAYDGRIFRADGITTMNEALGYTLSHPVATAIVGISTVEQLEENVRIAREFEPFAPEALQRIEDLTRHYADAANFFKHHW